MYSKRRFLFFSVSQWPSSLIRVTHFRGSWQNVLNGTVADNKLAFSTERLKWLQTGFLGTPNLWEPWHSTLEGKARQAVFVLSCVLRTLQAGLSKSRLHPPL